MIFSEKCISSIALIVWIISTHLTRVAICINCELEPRNIDGRLRKSLLCKYDKTVHPSPNGAPVLVTMTMNVEGFLFDEHQKVLHVSSWLRLTWQDNNLKWRPAEFNGISNFVEAAEELWHPGFQLFNSDIASVQTDECKDNNIDIASTGELSYIPACVHSARCEADFASWPFDSLNCTLHIGSWTNSADEVELKLNPLVHDMDEVHTQDKIWKMIKATYRMYHGNYSDMGKMYPSAMFTFSLERHSGVQAITFLVPALIMASINLITLWMSPEMSQRLMLLAFNVLSHFLFMQQMSWYIPHNGDTCPTIVLCFRDSLIITGLLLINTVIVRGFTSCGLDVPNWVGSTTESIGSNKFGQLFLSKSYLIDRQPLHSEQSEEGADVNVSEQQTVPTVTIKLPTNPWVLFARYIDRLLFIIVFVLYVCMYFTLVPKGYRFAEPSRVVEVVEM